MTQPNRHKIATFMRRALESGSAECWYCGVKVFRFLDGDWSQKIKPNHATFDHFISNANRDAIKDRAEMFGVVACSQCNNEKSLYSEKLTKYYMRRVQANVYRGYFAGGPDLRCRPGLRVQAPWADDRAMPLLPCG